MCPVTYVACQLGAVIADMPPRSRVVGKVSVLTLDSLTHLCALQAVSCYKFIRQRFSVQQQTSHEQVLLTNPSVILLNRTSNLATLLPLPDGGQPHSISHDALLLRTDSKPLKCLFDPTFRQCRLLHCGSSCRCNFQGNMVTGRFFHMRYFPHSLCPLESQAKAAELKAASISCTL